MLFNYEFCYISYISFLRCFCEALFWIRLHKSKTNNEKLTFCWTNIFNKYNFLGSKQKVVCNQKRKRLSAFEMKRDNRNICELPGGSLMTLYDVNSSHWFNDIPKTAKSPLKQNHRPSGNLPKITTIDKKKWVSSPNCELFCYNIYFFFYSK